MEEKKQEEKKREKKKKKKFVFLLSLPNFQVIFKEERRRKDSKGQLRDFSNHQRLKKD